jgi:cysteine desulfuration protein SufE
VNPTNQTVAAKLDVAAQEFAELEPRERLELLLEYAESLPKLPARYQAAREAGEHRVHECQTPVFLWVDVEGGKVHISADVAPEAPTVKGFVALLVDAFSGAPPEQIQAVQPTLIARLGLQETLGMMRMRGLHAILHTILRQVAKATASVEPGDGP